jgi:hypothetical protein
MASNVLTALMPSFYKGLNTVQQEITDVIDAVSQNMSLEQAALNQTITYPIAKSASLVNTPQSGVPDPSTYGQTPGIGTLSISNMQSGIFVYNGEEIHQLQVAGIYADYYADQMAQQVRALRKAVASSIITAALSGASRCCGTPGTAPFGTAGVLTGFATPNQILYQNGSPGSDRHMILGTNAIASIQGYQSVLFKANEAGTDRLLRTGTIGSVEGWAVGLDTTISTVSTFGTSSGDENTGAISVGDISFVLNSAGNGGSVLAGDTFHFTGDTTNVYVVASVSSRTITINAPGFRAAVSASTVVVFNSTAGQPNLFFTRDAITLIARQPKIATGNSPAGQLMDLTTIPDPRSGLIYQLAMWQNGRTIAIEVSLAWGVGVTNPQDLGILWG